MAGTALVIDRLFDDTSVRLFNFFVPLTLFSAPEFSGIKCSLANACEIKKILAHLNGHSLILFSRRFPVSSKNSINMRTTKLTSAINQLESISVNRLTLEQTQGLIATTHQALEELGIRAEQDFEVLSKDLAEANHSVI